MWKKIAIAGVLGAATLGGGAAALATTDQGSSSPAPSTTGTAGSSNTHTKADRDARLKLRHLEHAEWVSRDGSADVTHDAIRGTVTSVSATSISVKAQDGVSMTFTVGSDTKVALREGGKGSGKKGTIADVKSGDTALVAGVKTGSTLTAKHVLDGGTS